MCEETGGLSNGFFLGKSFNELLQNFHLNISTVSRATVFEEKCYSTFCWRQPAARQVWDWCDAISWMAPCSWGKSSTPALEAHGRVGQGLCTMG